MTRTTAFLCSAIWFWVGSASVVADSPSIHDRVMVQRSFYPWPVPVDSESSALTGRRDRQSSYRAWKRSGRDIQTILALQEQAKRVDPLATAERSRPATHNPDNSRRHRAYAWPKTLDPRRLSPRNWYGRGADQVEDPFVQAHFGHHDSRATMVRENPHAPIGARIADRRKTPFDPPSRYPLGRSRQQGPHRASEPVNQGLSRPRQSERLVSGDVGPGRDDTRFASRTLSQTPQPTVFKPTDVIAMVGYYPILAGDLLGQINELLIRQPGYDQATEDELNQQRTELMKRFLPQLVDAKLMYLDFRRTFPAENLPQIEQKVAEHFRDTELGPLMKKAQVSLPRELDAKLRSYGSSLKKQQRLFMERVFASQARARNVKNDEEVTHDEMLSYYQQHLADYEYPAKVRWERLMVRFDRFDNKHEAREAIARMGNQVYYGASLAAVAKRSSHGPNSVEGGYHDWTTQGSLVSKVLDQALFSIPPGKLSRILEDETGSYIVRVIERHDADRQSFLETQIEIEKKIREARFKKKVEGYLSQLRKENRIWTVFDQHTTTDPQTATVGPNQSLAY